MVAGGPGWRRSIDGLDDLLPVRGVLDPAGEAPARASATTPESPARGRRAGDPRLADRGRAGAADPGQHPTDRGALARAGRVTFVGPVPRSTVPLLAGRGDLWQRVLVGGRPGPADAGTTSPRLRIRCARRSRDAGSRAAGRRPGSSVSWSGTSGWSGRASTCCCAGWIAASGPGSASRWCGAGGGGAAVRGGGLRGPDVRLAAVSIVAGRRGRRPAPQIRSSALVAPTRGSYNLAMTDGLVRARSPTQAGGGAPADDGRAGRRRRAHHPAGAATGGTRRPGRFELRTLVPAPTPDRGRSEDDERPARRHRSATPARIGWRTPSLSRPARRSAWATWRPATSGQVSISLPTNGPDRRLAERSAALGSPVGARRAARRPAACLISQLVQPPGVATARRTAASCCSPGAQRRLPRITLGAGR